MRARARHASARRHARDSRKRFLQRSAMSFRDSCVSQSLSEAQRMSAAAGARGAAAAAAATGGYVPHESIKEPIPVGLLLTTPAKILCSALFVSGRDEKEVRTKLAHSHCYMNTGMVVLHASTELNRRCWTRAARRHWRLAASSTTASPPHPSPSPTSWMLR